MCSPRLPWRAQQQLLEVGAGRGPQRRSHVVWCQQLAARAGGAAECGEELRLQVLERLGGGVGHLDKAAAGMQGKGRSKEGRVGRVALQGHCKEISAMLTPKVELQGRAYEGSTRRAPKPLQAQPPGTQRAPSLPADGGAPPARPWRRRPVERALQQRQHGVAQPVLQLAGPLHLHVNQDGQV